MEEQGKYETCTPVFEWKEGSITDLSVMERLERLERAVEHNRKLRQELTERLDQLESTIYGGR